MIYCVLLNYNILIGGFLPLILHANDNQLTRRFTSPMAICINNTGRLGGKIAIQVSQKSVIPIPSLRPSFISYRTRPSHISWITITTSLEAIQWELGQGQVRMHDCGRSAGWLCCITDGLQMACGHKNTKKGEDSWGGFIHIFARGR
jgi:hypothetical protein